MAGQAQFKHIKVDTCEDDVVIFAGQHEDAQLTQADKREAYPSSSEPENAVQSELAIDAANSADSVEKASKSYRATILDDIESSKMPTTQKVVIVLAVVAIVAFIVWYAISNGVI